MDNQQITNDDNDIEEKFNSLPEEIQDIIYSPVTERTITEIGEKYQLHLDKVDVLIEATEDIMTGDVRANDFISHIVKTLEIPQETAEKIGQEIDQQVFEKIRDSIKSLHKEEPQEEKKTTIADIKTKEIVSSPVQTEKIDQGNYNIDPYREPVE